MNVFNCVSCHKTFNISVYMHSVIIHETVGSFRKIANSVYTKHRIFLLFSQIKVYVTVDHMLVIAIIEWHYIRDLLTTVE